MYNISSLKELAVVLPFAKKTDFLLLLGSSNPIWKQILFVKQPITKGPSDFDSLNVIFASFIH